MKIEISASVVAWYAAIVATVSAAVSIYNAWRDKARLMFRFSPSMQFPNDYSGKRYLVVTISNAGRRPITISHLAFSSTHKKAYEFIFTDSFSPKELHEGQLASYHCEQDKDLWKPVRYASICDSTGKTHFRRVPKHVIRAIQTPPNETEHNGQKG